MGFNISFEYPWGNFSKAQRKEIERELGNSGCMNNIVPVMVLLCMMKPLSFSLTATVQG